MSELTGQDVHAAYEQAFNEVVVKEHGEVGMSVGKPLKWQGMSATSRRAYERMADFLNEKIKHTTPYQPEMEMK